MNYLAHLFLAGPEPEALLGALMGDFVKGVLDERYPAAITRALALHRRIDTFTDAHPVTAASRARISPERRRFAGIMVDLFYDHFLARHWDEHAREPLDAFTARVYALLEQHDALLPERLRSIAPRMAQADWLASYARGGIDPRRARPHEPAAQAREPTGGRRRRAGSELCCAGG